MLPLLLQIVNPILGQVLGQASRETSPLVRTSCAVVSVAVAAGGGAVQWGGRLPARCCMSPSPAARQI